jgi:hypothetical protein
MSEIKNDLKPEPVKKKDDVPHNWITNIYDKLNIPVWVLDIMLVVLCAVVVFCFIYGANVQ